MDHFLDNLKQVSRMQPLGWQDARVMLGQPTNASSLTFGNSVDEHVGCVLQCFLGTLVHHCSLSV